MEEIRICYQRINLLRFISHLDTLRLFQRAFIRADIPVAYSEGFNPHPRISMGDPVSLGIESKEEYMDIKLSSPLDGDTLCKRLNAQLPKDIRILDYTYENLDKSIQSLINSCDYIFILDLKYDDFINLKKSLDLFLNEEHIMIKRKRKRRGKKIEIEENIKPLINAVKSIDYEEGFLNLKVNLSSALDAHLKPELFFDALMKFSEIEYDRNSLEIVKDCVYKIDESKGLI
ncbi:MAG: TIGR03936 family radical SAM-associated protein [Tissierellia bacterium]|nr:TIGR03936 family radical SAM-associated protein [Tissierellia bacterium]